MSLIVGTVAVDWLERLISRMICYLSLGMLS